MDVGNFWLMRSVAVLLMASRNFVATNSRNRFAVSLVFTSLGWSGSAFAPTASACVPGEDVNVLCSNEQQLVDL
jgi:hypothetical protein